MAEILSIVFAVMATGGLLALILWRIRKDDDAPPDNGGTVQSLDAPEPNSKVTNRTLVKRRTTLTAGVAAAVAQYTKTFDTPRLRLMVPIRRPRNKKVLRRVRKAERQARRRMYELRRLAA